MKFNRKLLERFMIALLILAPICIAIRLFTYWNEINAITGFFKDSSVGCLLYNTIAFLIFFLCIIFSLNQKGKNLAKRKKTSKKPLFAEEEMIFGGKEAEDGEDKLSATGFEKSVSTFEGTLSAFSLIFLALTFVSYGIAILLSRENYSDYYKLTLSLLSFLSGVFFLYFTFRNTTERNPVLGFFALTPVLWCILRLLTEYQDLTRFMNKGLYVGQFLFAISAFLFFLYQSQFLLGDKELTKPNSYAFEALSLLFFGMTARVPHLFALLGDKITMDLTDSTTLLVDLAITIFVAIKVSAIYKNA